jgi:hypothetical protein
MVMATSLAFESPNIKITAEPANEIRMEVRFVLFPKQSMSCFLFAFQIIRSGIWLPLLTTRASLVFHAPLNLMKYLRTIAGCYPLEMDSYIFPDIHPRIRLRTDYCSLVDFQSGEAMNLFKRFGSSNGISYVDYRYSSHSVCWGLIVILASIPNGPRTMV